MITDPEFEAGADPDSSSSGAPDSSERPSDYSVPPLPNAISVWWRFRGLIRTMRPHQWVKNVFVLAPVVFAREAFDSELLLRAGGAFAIFCILAACVYTLNDLVDAEADRAHPLKRFRPIASGRVTVAQAKGLLVVLLCVAAGGSMLLPWAFGLTAFVYLAQNLGYSFKLKHVAYLDVALIAFGFVLRVLAGGFAVQIEVSGYLLSCTALLALFLGFGKRRHELAVAQYRAGKQRAVLEDYTERGLGIALGLTALLTVAIYLAYTLDTHTMAFFGSANLWWTTGLVVLGVLRFLHLVRYRPRAESPTQEMLRDGTFVGIVMVWVGVVFWMVYNLKPS
jgi:4-hydroxybenzoate polyprenyltransferase